MVSCRSRIGKKKATQSRIDFLKVRLVKLTVLERHVFRAYDVFQHLGCSKEGVFARGEVFRHWELSKVDVLSEMGYEKV